MVSPRSRLAGGTVVALTATLGLSACGNKDGEGTAAESCVDTSGDTIKLGFLTERGDLSVLLVEQHVGFALRATSSYCALESGRITSRGDGGPGTIDAVRAAMAV